VGLIRSQPREHQEGVAEWRGRKLRQRGVIKGACAEVATVKLVFISRLAGSNTDVEAGSIFSSIHKTKCSFDSEYAVQDLTFSCEARHLLH
jgi:hypothetical protein